MNTSHLMDTLNFFTLIMLYIVRKQANKAKTKPNCVAMFVLQEKAA
jgi:hypothetical protein